MQLVKLEPRQQEADNSIPKTLEEINKIKWQELFAFGFNEEGEMFYVHSAGSVYEFLGMLSVVKKAFMEANED